MTTTLAVEPAAIADAAERFAHDIATHEMTVLHDDGLYRHLRFVRIDTADDGTQSRSSLYWFDLATWPGVLVINGDMGSYTFGGTTEKDMLVFFRGKQQINPGYWGQKVRGDMGLREYSEDAFCEHVTEAVDDYADTLQRKLLASRCAELGIPLTTDGSRVPLYGRITDVPAALLADIKPQVDQFMAALRAAVDEDVLKNPDIVTSEDAYNAVADFAFFRAPMDRYEPDKKPDYKFDSWDWDLTTWTYQYLWCCHAVTWGIARYDAATAAVHPAIETVELPAGPARKRCGAHTAARP